jgi:hypothetical protein
MHPWLPLMAEDLRSLYAQIRLKLGAALNEWTATDTSAVAVLKPWKNVFKEVRLNVRQTYELIICRVRWTPSCSST